MLCKIVNVFLPISPLTLGCVVLMWARCLAPRYTPCHIFGVVDRVVFGPRSGCLFLLCYVIVWLFGVLFWWLFLFLFSPVFGTKQTVTVLDVGVCAVRES